MKNTLKKNERLHSEKEFAHLFSIGNYFGSGCLGIKFAPPLQLSESIANLQMVASASKRKFKRAVKRNLLKRRIKEAYRLHKHELIEKLREQNKFLIVHFNYRADSPLPFIKIEKDMIQALKKLQETI